MGLVMATEDAMPRDGKQIDSDRDMVTASEVAAFAYWK